MVVAKVKRRHTRPKIVHINVWIARAEQNGVLDVTEGLLCPARVDFHAAKLSVR
jgi:hypothetical protein